MAEIDKLYEAFGELVYAVAKADGAIQNEERVALEDVLKDNKWASDIIWSFNYEDKKSKTVKEAYSKAIDIFKHHGPFSEYGKFADVLELVAFAFQGISTEEKEIISNFRNELTTVFKNDSNIQ
ncbi:hypothetical protein [Sporocytophaga myxococcoides]|uniref:hypothetical protein n=1 Tax=Sporocytophaga myxococcoides TaxID=153721 RepID=UPI0004273B47|nr:hypothetical protein [Sporocytophaga myxococcoides]